MRLEGDKISTDISDYYMAIAFGNEEFINVDALACATDSAGSDDFVLSDHFGNTEKFENFFDPALDADQGLTLSANELNLYTTDAPFIQCRFYRDYNSTDRKNDMNFNKGSRYTIHYIWGEKTVDGFKLPSNGGVGEMGTTSIRVPEDSAYTFMVAGLVMMVTFLGLA